MGLSSVKVMETRQSLNNTKTLYLFTLQYPFGSMETYLDSELPYLAEEFKQVIIQPMNGTGETRKTPKNTIISTPFWTTQLSKKCFFLRFLVRWSTWRYFFSETYEAIKNHNRKHPTVFLRILLWATYKAAFEKSKIVQDAIVHRNKSVAYSYWGHVPALGMETLAKRGVPTAVRYHRVDLYIYGMESAGWWHRNVQYQPWYHAAAHYNALNIFISNHGAHYFQQNWGNKNTPLNNIKVSRLGILDNGSSPLNRCVEDSLVIASCSHIIPVKQLHLVAAFVKALAQTQTVTWHHFGGGECDMLTQELSEDMPPNLNYKMWGHVANSTIINFYKTHHVDLFVNLSLSEGVPFSIMEAISFGIPTLATNVDGTSEVVIDGSSGLLCTVEEAYDSNMLAQRVISELNNGMLKKSKPRLVWEERFHADKNYKDIAVELSALKQKPYLKD